MNKIVNLGKILFFVILPIIINAKTFTLELTKNKVYVGEGIKATLTLSVDKNEDIINTRLEEFTSSNFWVKELNSTTIENNETTIIKAQYVIFPQLSGIFKIDKQKAEVAVREKKTNFTLWYPLYTKAVDIEVIALPKNVMVQGDFTIAPTVDKMKVDANEPVNFKLTIKGIGNIDDIKDFKLDLKEQLIFTTKASVTSNFENNQYGGTFVQKFSIVADKDFKIPSISFTYFNKKLKQILTIKTKPIPITVDRTRINIQYKDNIYNKWLKYIYLIIGFILGLLTYYFIISKKNKKTTSTSFLMKVKQARGNKALYDILLPYSQNKNIAKILDLLEENLYSNGKNKINKKKISLDMEKQ